MNINEIYVYMLDTLDSTKVRTSAACYKLNYQTSCAARGRRLSQRRAVQMRPLRKPTNQSRHSTPSQDDCMADIVAMIARRPLRRTRLLRVISEALQICSQQDT